MSAERAGECHCEATPDNIWKVLVIRRRSTELEESRCSPDLPVRNRSDYRLISLTCEGADENPSGSQYQTCEGQERGWN